MGNSCQRQLPNITLPCVNSGSLSSCCRNINDESNAISLYRWMSSTIHNGELSINESNAWFANFEDCQNSAKHNMKIDEKTWIHLHIYEWKFSSKIDHQLVYEKSLNSKSTDDVEDI